MNTKSKTIKIVSSLLGFAMVLSLVAGAVSPVQAMTLAEAEAQLAAVTAQLAALQGTPAYTFTKDLKLGSRDAEVKNLQKVLNASVDTQVAVSGVGSLGKETTYFGGLTKAAVIKYQTKNDISPAAGYVGRITRAKLNAVVVAGTTTPPTTGTTTATTTNIVTVSALSNPSGYIVSGSAQIPVLNFKVTNNTSQDVMVTSLKLNKGGLLSDSNIANIYLATGNNIVAQFMSFSGGVATFTGNLFSVKAGESLDVNVRVDITGAASSNVVKFNLMTVGDITVSAGTIAGTFPIVGGDFFTTSVSNPALSTITSLNYQGVATDVDSGTLGFRTGSLSFTVNNSAVKLMSVKYTVSGSINLNTDLQNLKLKINGAEVASVVMPTLDGKVLFDLSANAPTLKTGSQQMEVYADVLGTPNRTFKMEVLRPYDWVLQDTAYGTNISGGTPGGTATTINVRAGTATLALSSDTPTGNIARGGSGVTLAKFTIKASGEALRVKWLPFTLTEAGGATWATIANVDANVRNIALFADDGSQVGTTINTPSTCTGNTSTATTFTCSFGTPSSNINYIVPANTTRTLSLKADIQSAGDVTTLRGALVAPAGNYAGSNLEGQVSYQTSSAPGGAISGSIRTIAVSPFQATQNSALATQTFVGGATSAKIGSYSVSASSAEKINVSSITIKTSAGVSAGLNLQNLSIRVGGTVWNYVQSTVGASQSYTFSSPTGTTGIIAGGSVLVDVYADVLSNSTVATYVAPTALVGAVGFGEMTNSSQTLKRADGVVVDTTNTVPGQNTIIATVGTLTVSVDASDSAPDAQQIVQGAVGVNLGQFKLAAGANEDMKVDQVIMTASSTVTGAPATFSNLRLVDTSTGLEVATGQALQASTTALGAYTSVFTFTPSLVITKSTTKIYKVLADVASISASPASHNKPYVVGVLNAGDIVAYGATSNTGVVAAGTFPLLAETQTVLKTKLTAAMTLVGNTTGRMRSTEDKIGSLVLTANMAEGVEFNGVTIKLIGTASIPNSTNITLSLLNSDNSVATSSTVTTAVATSTGIALNLPTPFSITQGTSKTYTVQIDSSGFLNPTPNTTEGFGFKISANTDLRWSTIGASPEGLNLETGAAVPALISVQYE